MGFMMPKAQMPNTPPPPPVAPDFTGAMMSRAQNASMKSALGGTFLTAGQKLGTSGQGKSILG